MCDRVIGCVRPLHAAALALPLLLLCGGPAALAQTPATPQTTAPPEPSATPHKATEAELEKRVMDIVDMFQKDPRYNRAKTPEQIKDSVEFVTGNVLFILAHETGHALISEMGLPVLGKEEDAADSLATIVALKMSSAFADRVVRNAARGWFLSDQRDRKEDSPNPYYDEHGMDVQRAYSIVCLMVGGAPEKFMSLANEVKLPEERQGTCQGDFSNASWSWEQVLKPHMRKPGDPKAEIKVNYTPTKEYANLSMLGQKLQILETVAAWLSEDFVWKRPITLEMQECDGDPNARWDLATQKVIMCYEMIRDFVQLYRGYGQSELVPGTPTMTKNKKIFMAARATRVAAKGGRTAAAKGNKNRNQKAFRAERPVR